MTRLVYVLLFAAAGCASLKELARSSPTSEEWRVINARSKSVALASGLVRESERAVIESTFPHVNYHVLSGIHYVSYSIAWAVSGSEILVIHGHGDMLTLDRAKVERLPNQSRQPTAAEPRQPTP